MIGPIHAPAPRRRDRRAPSFLVAATGALAVLVACSDRQQPEGPDPGPPSGLPAAVGDLRVLAADSGSVTVAWTAPGVTGNPNPVGEYDLRRAALDDESAPWPDWMPVAAPPPAAPGSPQQATAAPLPAGSTWIFRLRARSTDTWSTLSNPAVATALPDWDLTPPAAVADLELRWRSEHALLVSWSATGDDGHHGRAAGYEVRHGPQPPTAANWPDAVLAPAPLYDELLDRWTCRIDGLDEEQTLQVAVRAFDDAGNWSEPSGPVTAPPPAGTVWHVRLDGSGTAPTIADGVRNARPGDLVLVHPGRYTWTNQGGPMHDLGLIFVGRDTTDFTLASAEGPAVTIIDAERLGRVLFVQGYNDGLVIEGFTITGGVSTPADGATAKAGGLTFHLTSTTVRDCVFTNNRGGEGGGIYYGGVGRPTLERCVIRGNHADDHGGGIFAVNVSGPGQDPAHGLSLIDCVVADNSAGAFGGGLCLALAVVRLERTIIAGNSAAQNGGGVAVIGHAMQDHPDTWVDLVGCTIAANRAPLGGALRLTADGVQFRNARVRLQASILAEHPDRDAFSVRADSQLEIGCSDLHGNRDADAPPAGAVDLGGNFSLPPRFADRTGPLAWCLEPGSPCLPGAHPDGAACGLIGARGLQPAP